MSSLLLRSLPAVARASHGRQFSVCAPLCQSDAVQKLFLDSLAEFAKRSKSAKDGLVEPSDRLVKDMKAEEERVARVHGFAPGEDTTTFPTFKFNEPTLDPINMKK